jgi:hypothetical protein
MGLLEAHLRQAEDAEAFLAGRLDEDPAAGWTREIADAARLLPPNAPHMAGARLSWREFASDIVSDALTPQQRTLPIMEQVRLMWGNPKRWLSLPDIWLALRAAQPRTEHRQEVTLADGTRALRTTAILLLGFQVTMLLPNGSMETLPVWFNTIPDGTLAPHAVVERLCMRFLFRGMNHWEPLFTKSDMLMLRNHLDVGMVGRVIECTLHSLNKHAELLRTVTRAQATVLQVDPACDVHAGTSQHRTKSMHELHAATGEHDGGSPLDMRVHGGQWDMMVDDEHDSALESLMPEDCELKEMI